MLARLVVIVTVLLMTLFVMLVIRSVMRASSGRPARHPLVHRRDRNAGRHPA